MILLKNSHTCLIRRAKSYCADVSVVVSVLMTRNIHVNSVVNLGRSYSIVFHVLGEENKYVDILTSVYR